MLELVPVLSLLRNFMYKSQTVKVLQMIITSPVSVYMLIIVPSRKVVVSNNYYKWRTLGLLSRYCVKCCSLGDTQNKESPRNKGV